MPIKASFSNVSPLMVGRHTDVSPVNVWQPLMFEAGQLVSLFYNGKFRLAQSCNVWFLTCRENFSIYNKVADRLLCRGLTWRRRRRSSRCERWAGRPCRRAVRGRSWGPGRPTGRRTTESPRWRETSGGCSLEGETRVWATPRTFICKGEGSVLRLTDPEVNVIEEEAAQHLVQGPVHLQPRRSSHQPLQQLLQLFGHVLKKNHNIIWVRQWVSSAIRTLSVFSHLLN